MARRHALPGPNHSTPSRFRQALLKLTGQRTPTNLQFNRAYFGGTVVSSQNGNITLQVGEEHYRLEEFEQPRLLHVGRSDQPSHLLAADNAVIPFWGRRRELMDLQSWRDNTESSFAIRLLYGPAGQGKTRLAQRFAELSRAAGWHVLRATRDWTGSPHQESRVPPGSAGESPGRTLIVVDYADRWPPTDLIRLMQNPRISLGRTRVLMLARSARWWTLFVHELHRTLAVPADVRPLESAAADIGDLGLLHRHAWRTFAEILRVAGAPRPPAFPRGVRDTTILDVQMTALADVYARMDGVASPADPLALSAYLLDRERSHWARMHREAQSRTPHETMGRAVLIATLLDRVPQRAAVATLASAGLAAGDLDGQQIIDDHTRLYLPTTEDHVLDPLAPDRLGEDFVGLESPGHRIAGREPDPWASNLLARTVIVADLDVLSRRHLTHAVMLFTSAAVRWPHLAHQQLLPLLREDPGIALRAGAPAVAALLELPGLDAAIMEAILARLPGDRQINYVDAAVELAERLAGILLQREHDPQRRAEINHMLGVRLLHARKFASAEKLLGDEIRLRRELAVDPSDRLQFEALAEALALLAEAQEAQRQYSRALDAASEAQRRFVGIRYQRDEQLGVAIARITELKARLCARLRQTEQAIEEQASAVEIWRRLSVANALHLPSLAQALDVQARYLARRGHAPEAVDTAETALRIWRQLAEAVPHLYEARLALSLDGSLHLWQWNSRRLNEAVAETISRFRPLMRDNLYFQVRFCRSAVGWAKLTVYAGKRLELLQEAIGLADRLVRVNPEHYRGDKAELLFAFAQNAYWASYRLGDGLLAAEEAEALFAVLSGTSRHYQNRLAACRHLCAEIRAELGGLDLASMPDSRFQAAGVDEFGWHRVANGWEKTDAASLSRQCPRCAGGGVLRRGDVRRVCPDCGGSGQRPPAE
jgi:hypothetical protein